MIHPINKLERLNVHKKTKRDPGASKVRRRVNELREKEAEDELREEATISR